MAKPTKAQLVAAAKELNDLMGLKPAINTEGKDATVAKLTTDLQGATKHLAPEDNLTDDTRTSLTGIGIELPTVETPDDSTGATGAGADEGKKDSGKGKTAKPKVTKKSIVIEHVSLKKGATVEEIAQKITDAGLGDLDRNIKTTKLWLRKLGFAVKKDDNGRYTKA